jgi:hypothetical protein
MTISSGAGGKKPTVLVVDPRGAFGPTELARPAPRPARLDSAHIVLFDNSKMHPLYGEYHAIFDVVSAYLSTHAVDSRTSHEAMDLLACSPADRARLAATLRAHDVTGAVIALCDWGVSQATALFADELEQLGIPTVLIGVGDGVLLARSTAERTDSNPPVIAVSSPRWADYETVAEEARQILPKIIASLSGPVAAAPPRDQPAWTPDHDGLVELDGVDADGSFTAAMAAIGVGDGLPLRAPTVERVDAFLGAAAMDATTEVWPVILPRRMPVLARAVAAIAVAAGCSPKSAPVVFAAYQAMAEPEFKLGQTAITTHPAGTLVLVSGPASSQYGIEAGRGSLGPGFAANATIGRAVALAYSFLLDARPGVSDLTTQGSPAEYSYCCAEAIEASPWPGWHHDLGQPDATTVTVLRVEGPHVVLDAASDNADALLTTFASVLATLGGNNAYVPDSQSVVFINPGHASLLAALGLSKQDVQRRLFELARNDREQLLARRNDPPWPADFADWDRIPVVIRAEDILVVVTGGPGPNSQVAIPWGHSRGVSRAIPTPT